MSVVQNPITGRSRGKYSSSVFAKWKGLNTLRSKPLTVNQPNTAPQLEQRSVFGAAVFYARQILSMIRFSLKYSAINITEFNAFIRNLIGVIDRSTFVIDPALAPTLIFAAGPEPGLEDSAVAYASGANFVLTWDDTYMASLREVGDKIVVFMFNETQNKLSAIDTAVLFSTGTATVAHGGAASDVIHIFACVCTASYSRFSPSIFVDEITVS